MIKRVFQIGRRFRSVLMLWLGVVVGVAGAVLLELASLQGPSPQPLTISQIRDLSSLVTTEVQVVEVQQAHLCGYTGGMTAILLVKGDVQLAVDLERGHFEAIDEAARTAVLVLPSPIGRNPRLDQDRTRLVWLGSYGLWRVVPGERASACAVNQAYQQAQEKVAAAAEDPALLARARRHAEAGVHGAFAMIGWDVQVRWEEVGE